MISEILKELLCKMPMCVVKAYPYFGTFVRIYLFDVDGQSISIRINLCDWIFSENSKVLATSSSDSNKWAEMIAILVGSKLLDIVQHNAECLELVFESGKSFVLKANLEEYEIEDELIVIYVPEKYGIGYSPKRGFRKDFAEKSLN